MNELLETLEGLKNELILSVSDDKKELLANKFDYCISLVNSYKVLNEINSNEKLNKTQNTNESFIMADVMFLQGEIKAYENILTFVLNKQ